MLRDLSYLRYSSHARFLFSFCSVLLPIVVALVSYIVRWIMDLTCSSWSTVCRASSDMLSHIFAVVMFFMLIIAFTKAKQISEALQRVKGALELLADGGKTKKD